MNKQSIILITKPDGRQIRRQCTERAGIRYMRRLSARGIVARFWKNRFDMHGLRTKATPAFIGGDPDTSRTI